jgi:hypothetical protein
MIVVKAYLYSPVAEVEIFDTRIFSVRNHKVYSRPIKVYQGIDNPVQVIIKNQDQKAVNLMGYAVQADIQDPTNQVTVKSYAVAWTDQSKGLGSFVIDKLILDQLEQRFYKLTFKTINSSTLSEAPVYVDDSYQVPLDLEVLPAYYATTLTAFPQPEMPTYVDAQTINTPVPPGTNTTILDGGTL